MKIEIRGEWFILCAEKCILRLSNKALYIADAHIGKSNHFRKAGIAVPSKLIFEEVKKLHNVIEKYKAEKIYFLGDLFHSVKNDSVEIFTQMIAYHEDKSFILIKGNHDLMPKIVMEKTGIEVVEKVEEDMFLFSHEKEKTTKFNFFGHIHPAINMVGKGKQSVRLSCFVFGAEYAILPAFGVFTGTATLAVDDSMHSIYVVTDKEVICVKT